MSHTHHSPQHQLPAGCHDANTAAELLGMSKKALLKRMRELGWLIVSGGAKNLPRREYVQAGLMATQDRGYALKGNPDIAKTYRVMLLTQRGFQELKKVIDPNTNMSGNFKTSPRPAPRREPHERPRTTQGMTPEQRRAAERERDRALADLERMGLGG